MHAIVCTGNNHKVAELAALLPEWSLAALPDYVTLPEETAATFDGNALIKARGARDILRTHEALPADTWLLADDSGLSVDALEGAPGVHSARYAGTQATDADNVAKLLAALATTPAAARSAHFSCVLIAISPTGHEFVAHGTVHGAIAGAPAGGSGFGYDPVFIPFGHTQTLAKLGAEFKQQHSHRAAAVADLRRLIPLADAPLPDTESTN